MLTPSGHVDAVLDVNGDGLADIVVGADNSAYLYLGNKSASPSPVPLSNPDEATASADFGASVASAGDVNGDGYADVVVGSSNANKAYIYLGGQQGLGDSAEPLLPSDQMPQFGCSVFSAGDVDGDGFADALSSGTVVVPPICFSADQAALLRPRPSNCRLRMEQQALALS